MTTAWVLGTASLMVTTIGALLVFLYLSNSPQSPEDWVTPEGKRAYAKHRRRLILSAALLAAWLLVQNVAVLVL